MAQMLRALTALPEILSSIPSNYLEWVLMPSSGTQAYMQAERCTHTHTHTHTHTQEDVISKKMCHSDLKYQVTLKDRHSSIKSHKIAMHKGI